MTDPDNAHAHTHDDDKCLDCLRVGFEDMIDELILLAEEVATSERQVGVSAARPQLDAMRGELLDAIMALAADP